MNKAQRRHNKETRIRNIVRLYRMKTPRWSYYDSDHPFTPHRWRKSYTLGFNPPSWRRKLWRQEYRAFCKQQLREELSSESLQTFPLNKITSIYDWY